MQPRLSLAGRDWACTVGQGSPPVLAEGDVVHFQLHGADALPASAWRLRLGDILPHEPGGEDFGHVVTWKRRPWFNCCRGRVPVVLERNPDPEAHSSSQAGWEHVLDGPALVSPSKLTDEQWDAMQAALEAAAPGLASDLIGHSSAGLRAVRGARTTLDEVQAAKAAIRQLRRALALVDQPLAVLKSAAASGHRPLGRLDGASVKALVRQGVDPRRRIGDKAPRGPARRIEASLDVEEHRQIASALLSARQALAKGIERAQTEAAEITADRPWRDRVFKPGEATLYERLDKPRLEKLEAAVDTGTALRLQARSLLGGAILSGAGRTTAPLAPTSAFERLPAYRLAYKAMTEWLMDGQVLVEAGASMRLKPTNRMYEQWVFLELAAGLQGLGFTLEEAGTVFRQMGKRRYVMDLPRGATLSFKGPVGQQATLRYEPWIRPLNAARQAGDEYFHGKAHDTAWSPDVILEIASPEASNPVTVVVDAKYARDVRPEHWDGVHKYAGIRRLADQRPVEQVWIAAPVAGGITFTDDMLAWTASGLQAPPGTAIAFGVVGMTPAGSAKATGLAAGAKSLVQGLVAQARLANASGL